MERIESLYKARKAALIEEHGEQTNHLCIQAFIDVVDNLLSEDTPQAEALKLTLSGIPDYEPANGAANLMPMLSKHAWKEFQLDVWDPEQCSHRLVDQAMKIWCAMIDVTID